MSIIIIIIIIIIIKCTYVKSTLIGRTNNNSLFGEFPYKSITSVCTI